MASFLAVQGLRDALPGAHADPEPASWRVLAQRRARARARGRAAPRGRRGRAAARQGRARRGRRRRGRRVPSLPEPGCAGACAAQGRA